MLFALVHLVLRRVVVSITGSNEQMNTEVELVVLRHQLMVLAPGGEAASSPP